MQRKSVSIGSSVAKNVASIVLFLRLDRYAHTLGRLIGGLHAALFVTDVRDLQLSTGKCNTALGELQIAKMRGDLHLRAAHTCDLDAKHVLGKEGDGAGCPTVAKTVAEALGVKFDCAGESYLSKVLKGE